MRGEGRYVRGEEGKRGKKRVTRKVSEGRRG